MQFQVPQNIDLEDKIIGPLTLKQFIFLLVGGMFDYMWYTFFDTGAFILLAIPTTVLALALAFARMQDQPFPKFLGSLIIFVLRPKILTWGKTRKPKIIESPEAKKEKIHPKMIKESQIQKLSQIVDTQGWRGAPGSPRAGQPEAGRPWAEKPVTPLQKKESFIERITHLGAHEKPQPAASQPRTTTAKTPPVIRPKISQPQRKDWHPAANAQIITPEELEKELGLADRVKTHQVAKPQMNLGPASENNPEDVLDKADQGGAKK